MCNTFAAPCVSYNWISNNLGRSGCWRKSNETGIKVSTYLICKTTIQIRFCRSPRKYIFLCAEVKAFLQKHVSASRDKADDILNNNNKTHENTKTNKAFCTSFITFQLPRPVCGSQ